jgi:hypothetical protein
LLESNREIWPYSKNKFIINVATIKPQPQKKKKKKKKTMYILLAILKFLLAKYLKFSQKKKADFCNNVRLSGKQNSSNRPIHANQPHKFCGLIIYLFSEPLYFIRKS